jgi:SecD/SecF fusion protein
MRNKTAITVLTVIITALCLFALSFSLVERQEEESATEYATNSKGEFSEAKKQHYLDSIYDQPVYNFLGYKFTYKEVKENALGLGLDLKGGMHVTLEISPVEIIIALSGNNTDPAFRTALARTQAAQSNSTDNFTDLFYKAYREQKPEGTLKNIFQSNLTKGRIDRKSTDDQVMKVINQEVDLATDRALLILRSRIDKFGVTSPNIQKIKGTNRILVELPGVNNPTRVRNLIQGVAQLEFLEVRFLNEIGPFLTSMNNYLLAKEKNKSADTTKIETTKSSLLSDTVLKNQPKSSDSTAASAKLDSGALAKADSAKADTTQNKLSSFFKLRKFMSEYDQSLRYDLKDTAKINRILADPKVQAMMPSNTRFFWEKKPREGTTVLELVPVKRDRTGKNILTGDVITRAREELSQDRKSHEVSMSMNGLGAKKWKKMTAEASRDPQNKRRIAIVLDNYVYSAPTVQNEIPNGQSSISGDFTFEDAKDLANVLEVGKMPAPVRIVEEAIVGPSLGKEAIGQGLNSALMGLVLVVLFMMVYYGKGGFIADFALIFNIFFILGILAQPQLGTVLTLPGIAGMVLTMGMSVDANVLIFERIREELRNGKSVTGSIALGYDKAFSSIFDSNITTIITALILAIFGSGPVKGFAITLIIGIITSFFTAVFITRVILEWMDKRKMITEKSFETGLSKNLFRGLNFDFIGNRKKAYIFSSTLIAIGFAAIIMKGGLTMGVDFKGGRSYIVKFDKPVEASDLKSKMIRAFENKGTEVKTYGENTKLKITTSYLVDDESAAADEKVIAALNAGLKDYSSYNPMVVGSSKVGATIADDIKKTSAVAIILSLIAIFLYVFLRFKRWQFGAGGLIALGHDVLMCIAAYGIAELIGFPFEVDQIFIAAILTVIGYSINDTVVVFDRIRETLELNPRLELNKTMNLAINDTISRTIITAATVFIVSLVLFIFGGETLRGFSLVMLIGSTFGTYSSIFIASPIVVDFASKKQLEEKAPVKKEAKKESLKA